MPASTAGAGKRHRGCTQHPPPELLKLQRDAVVAASLHRQSFKAPPWMHVPRWSCLSYKGTWRLLPASTTGAAKRHHRCTQRPPPELLKLQRATTVAASVHRRICKGPLRMLPASPAGATEAAKLAVDDAEVHRRSCKGPQRLLLASTAEAAKRCRECYKVGLTSTSAAATAGATWDRRRYLNRRQRCCERR
jgi:hypothetical protein